MRRRPYIVLVSLLAAVIFAASALIANRVLRGARIDFTASQLYTPSDVTRSVLRNVAEPVELTLIYSRRTGQDYPAIRAYAARVRELLETYENASGGRVRLRVMDPLPFSPAEDEALASGIAAIETSGEDPLYFGLVGRNAIDDERVIPFLSPDQETTLEYDLTRMIARLEDPEPPRIGVLTNLDGLAGPNDDSGYIVRGDIAKSFAIELIDEDFAALPEDMDVLLVAHVPGLSSWQWWLIDQYILRHGRAVFLVDPAAKLAAPGTSIRSDFGPLAEAWQIRLSDDALADAADAWSIPVDRGNGTIDQLAHPLFIDIPSADMNPDDIVTADLTRTVRFGAPGAILPGDIPKGAELMPLIRTGPSPSFIDAATAARDITPAETLRVYKTESDAFILAARLSGTLTTAFPKGAPPLTLPRDPARAEEARAAAANAGAPLVSSQTQAEIILIADTDFLADEFYAVQGGGSSADNAALLLNALDALSGGGDLARLRSRAASQRPMTRIVKMRADAQASYFRQQDDLEARLKTVQARLTGLQAEGAGAGTFAGDIESHLSTDERAELAALKTEIVTLRERLRDIERDYRSGIDRLEGILRLLNIWLGPLIVALAGIIIWRRRLHRNGAR